MLAVRLMAVRRGRRTIMSGALWVRNPTNAPMLWNGTRLAGATANNCVISSGAKISTSTSFTF
jgi:hypothetical protein